MAAETAATTTVKKMKKKTDLAESLRLARPSAAADKRPERVGKKGFLVYLDPELLHQVKIVALAERKTLQEIGVEALEGLVVSRSPAAAG
ncbi:MAG: hypothetical protein F4133_12630 [Gammaproteobacteria bacterium]|nr:hypothetical protein [Gammaproteobacteria bacterium]